jgi:hypothetical protein
MEWLVYASRIPLLFLGLLMLISGNAQAHKMRSVLLTVTELPALINNQASSKVVLDLKSSLNREGRPASVAARFEPACQPQGRPVAERIDDAVLRRYAVVCNGGLAGRQLHLDGLDPTTPDAFIEIRFANGASVRHGLSRSNSSISMEEPQVTDQTTRPSALWAYFGIGVEHILLCIDHLLFVLGLLLLLGQTGSGWKKLLSTITAFTVAHSMTLGLAVLAGITLPSTPVEIVIALSILLLACEIYRYPQRQQQGLPPTLTASKPWLVAFGFGLLHGFGFAGALSEIGVPEQAVGWALLLFNLGVEFGQLLFVAIVLLLFAVLGKRAKARRLVAATQEIMVYSLGGLAVFWILDRSSPLLGL